jgi:hypothetical protein
MFIQIEEFRINFNRVKSYFIDDTAIELIIEFDNNEALWFKKSSMEELKELMSKLDITLNIAYTESKED